MSAGDILAYVLPPLLGAIIGYVTNALAIRMLFRPLTKKHILGIPIPLTPGIIPRQREQLAHSIARMVSRSLFNSTVILNHIRGEAFQEGLVFQIQRIFGQKTGTGAGAVAGPADRPNSQGENEQLTAENNIETRIERVENLLLPVMDADITRRLLRLMILRISDRAAHKSINELLPSGLYETSSLESFIRNLIEGSGYRKLSWAVVLWLRRHEHNNTPVRKFFTRVQLSRIMHIIDRFYAPGVNGLMGFLRRPDIRRELVRRGKSILSDILLHLRPVQRMMLSAGQYDRTLEESMPGIVRDLLRSLEETLRSQENREKILMALHQFIADIQERGLQDLEDEYGVVLSRNLYRLLKRFRYILLEGDAPARFSEMIHKSLKSSGDLDSILQRFASLDLHTLLMKLYDGLYDILDSPQRRGEIRSMITGILTEARKKGAVPQQEKPIAQDNGLARAGAGALTGIMEGAVPSLVEHFNIYQMVVDRINSLDIEEVEDLLLGIIARHLKFINLFGAILGAMIGGLQIFLSALGV